jgi:hypothetical protein
LQQTQKILLKQQNQLKLKRRLLLKQLKRQLLMMQQLNQQKNITVNIMQKTCRSTSS